MTKLGQLVEKIVVTFFEGAVAFIIINNTDLSGNPKKLAIGASAAGLSLVYNVVRQSNPTIQPTILPSTPPVDQSPPANPPAAPVE